MMSLNIYEFRLAALAIALVEQNGSNPIKKDLTK